MSTLSPGFITASTFHPIIANKSSLGQGAHTLAKTIAMERAYLTGDLSEEVIEYYNFTNKHVEWGQDHEREAIEAFERQELLIVDKTNENQESIVSDKYSWLSCTPDGLISNNALVEAKCPSNPANHLNHILGDWEKNYINQVKFQLFVSEREYGYLVSYDKRYYCNP